MKELSFNSIEELNAAIRSHRANNKLNATELAVLDVLAQYSCKDVGRSFLSKSTIAELVGKSRRTIIRVFNRLEELGIICQYARKRQTGDRRQTSNLIVIQTAIAVNSEQAVTRGMDLVRQANDQTTDVTPDDHNLTRQEAPSINSKNKVIYNTYSAPTASNEQPRNLSTPYVQFRDMVANFVSDSKLTNKLWGVYLAQTKYLRVTYETSELLAEGIEALKVTFQTTKRKAIRNLAGYYNGTLAKLLDELYMSTMAEMFAEMEA